MAGLFSKPQGKHHDLTAFVSKCEGRRIDRLLTRCGFALSDPLKNESAELYNLVTKVGMPETVKNDLCQQSEIGRSLYETFLKDRFI